MAHKLIPLTATNLMILNQYGYWFAQLEDGEIVLDIMVYTHNLN